TLVFPDKAAQAEFVRNWREGLEYFERVDVALTEHRAHIALTLGRGTNFYLHYVGEPFVDLQQRYAAVVARLAHALVPPDVVAGVPRRPREPGRLRVGVMSPFMRRHTVSKLFKSLIDAL